ncbi:DNA-processing protein DprA [Borrelia sp. CA_690]|uniref:DNA-protecting protein DprA n=1 Tax=Borrelia maritima TaxID=2761123 RepID=A0A5J6WE28_9SPIR|nr:MULTISPECIES: DNA-processing protein DprA [Borrelia]QFI14432.1 DNA-protecting protein DprA [Borrelia maritima]WKC84798.1 DNA-processing protein DprA [Borrelia sp. CA_690]
MKLLYIDNLKFLKGKEKLKLFNNFDLNDIIKLTQKEIESYLSKSFRKSFKLLDLKLIELQEKVIRKTRAKIAILRSKFYPNKLKRIYDPPFAIYYKGNLPNFSSLSWVVVGSRRISKTIAERTREFSSHLAKNGIEIVSGFAIGADIESHIAAINENSRTFAVIPTDIDNIYPKQNLKYVFKLLEQGGGIITETLPFDKIQNYFFAKRNRLISGLSDAIFITYASLKSGALIIAELGLDLGLDVYVYNLDFCGDGAVKLHDFGVQEIKTIKDLYDLLNIKYIDSNNIEDNPEEYCDYKNVSDVLIGELLKELYK